MTKHLLTYPIFLSLKIQTILKKITFVIYHKYYLNNPFRKLKIYSPLDKIELIAREKITNEKFALKFEAKISAIKNYIDCEFSEVNKKINSVSENMNQPSKMFDTIQKDRSLLLNENIEFLKNELKSKDEMINSLIETQTLVLETVKNSKANPAITSVEKKRKH